MPYRLVESLMHQSLEPELREGLVGIVRESAWFMAALETVQSLGLASWCIGAGAVRNLVWDKLHGFNVPSLLPDIDVAYFDPDNLSAEQDKELEQRLAAAFPGTPWEVTNQAAVHQWYEGYFGQTVTPLMSLQEAVASWPEFATAVGITLLADNTIEVMAPHGLEDLFELVVRHNPVRASVSMYQARLVQKRYLERWPKVRVVPS